MVDFTRPSTGPFWRALNLAAKLALIGYLALLTYMSLTPVVEGVPDISDKVIHFIAYCGLTALLAAALPRIGLLKIFITASLVGLALEITQGALGMGRTASAADQIANMMGSGLALSIWAAIARLRSNVRTSP